MWKTRRHNLRDKCYSFVPVTGWMYSKPIAFSKACFAKIDIPSVPEKCIKNLQCVNNPFLVPRPQNEITDLPLNICLRLYGRLLIWLSRHFYPMLYLMSFLRLNIFRNGTDAARAFALIEPKNQHILCLSRSIFIATTSRKFKMHGTLFIGALLPSRSLHAWVMENGANVCAGDVYWTNYTPLAIMY